MPPKGSRKRKSSDSSTTMVLAKVPVPLQAATEANDAVRTPEVSPRKRKAGITEGQKQALMDNLQLEITERARKLRALYALHAQGLRSRLERRVNRIPQSLRATNIMQLIDKYAEPANPPKPANTATSKAPIVEVSKSVGKKTAVSEDVPSSARSRGTKRPSIEMASDKENVHLDHDITMPKKRAKAAAAMASTTTTTNSRAGRTASRKVVPSQVLSPKSNNSRTLPRSPLKPSGAISPPKSYLSRPTSPLKPPVPIAPVIEKPATSARTGRTASKQVRGGPTAVPATTTGRSKAAANSAFTNQGRTSHGSSASDSSAGTTIVTKKKVSATAATKTTKAATGTMGRKGTAGKTVKQTPAPAVVTGGGRVLRTRR